MKKGATLQCLFNIVLLSLFVLGLPGKASAGASFDPTQGVIVQCDFGNVSGYKLQCVNSALTAKATGSLGTGWIFSLDASLKASPDAQAVLVSAFSKNFSFLQAPDGTYKPIPGTTGALDRLEEEFYLTSEGIKLHFSKDGVLKSVQDKSGDSCVFSFDGKGRLSGWTLKSDKTVDVSFDDNLGMNSGSSENGKIEWGKEGLINSISGKKLDLRFSYENGKLKGAVSSSGRKWSFAYDDKFRIAKFAEPGKTCSITYDADGRAASLESSTGEAQYFKYAAGKDADTVKVWNSATERETVYTTNPKTLIVIESKIYSPPETTLLIDREKGTAGYSTADGNTYSLVRKPDDSTEFRSLIKGSIPMLMTITPDEMVVRNEAGKELYREKTAVSRFISGNVGEFKANGLLKDSSGNVLEMISGGNTIATFKYDNAGLLKEIISPSEKVIASLKYDDGGRLLSITNAVGDKTSYRHDALNRSITVIAADGTEKQYYFDEGGRPVKTVYPMGKEIRYGYGKDGMVSSVESPGFDLQEYYNSYDGSKSYLSSTLSGRWDFRSVDDGKFVVRASPDSLMTNFCYDGNKRLYATTDEKGQALAVCKYDKAGNLANFANAGVKYDFSYDNLGRRSSVKELNSGYGMSYTYSGLGAVCGIRDSDKDVTDYLYDSAGRPLEITSARAGKFTVKYNSIGMPALLSRPNGVKTKWEYDEMGRLSRQSNKFPDEKDNFSLSYKYDNVGNIHEITSSKDGLTSIKYDHLAQLSGIKAGKEGEQKIEYDKFGNLLRYGNAKAEFKANGLVKFSEILEYSCDDYARIKSAKSGKDILDLKYDRDNRLDSVFSNGKEFLSFGYDNRGRLAISREGGIPTRYFYSFGYLCAAVSPDRKETVKYVNSPITGECLALIRADGKVEYPLTDPSGTVTHLTNEKGAITSVRQFEIIGLTKGEDKMRVAMGYCGNIQFLNGRITFIDGIAFLTQAARAMSVRAPVPEERALKSYNPLSMLNANPFDRITTRF
jgi:YD repeat-containing protein